MERVLPNNRSPSYCNCGMASPDSVLTTAEDSLLVTPQPQFKPRPISPINSSIAANRAARQRYDLTVLPSAA